MEQFSKAEGMREGQGLPEACYALGLPEPSTSLMTFLLPFSAPCSKSPCCYKTTQLPTLPVTRCCLQRRKPALTMESFCRPRQALAGSRDSQCLLPRVTQREKQSQALELETKHWSSGTVFLALPASSLGTRHHYHSFPACTLPCLVLPCVASLPSFLPDSCHFSFLGPT